MGVCLFIYLDLFLLLNKINAQVALIHPRKDWVLSGWAPRAPALVGLPVI